jgi:hypothetical protein
LKKKENPFLLLPSLLLLFSPLAPQPNFLSCAQPTSACSFSPARRPSRSFGSRGPLAASLACARLCCHRHAGPACHPFPAALPLAPASESGSRPRQTRLCVRAASPRAHGSAHLGPPPYKAAATPSVFAPIAETLVTQRHRRPCRAAAVDPSSRRLSSPSSRLRAFAAR